MAKVMLSLEGVRVVSMALNVPGPVAVARLTAHGASVLKVEPPGGDPLEAHCPTWYRELHEGIAVERLDLKAEAGRARMRVLLEGADLFVSSQRPAALSRLGLPAPAHLRALNIVGEAARPEVAGHDLTYVARAGLIGAEMPRTLFADLFGAERVFARLLLLLREPPGTRTQMGLDEGLASLAAPLRHGLTGPGTVLGGALPTYRVYETRKGHVAVAALEPHFRARLYERLDLVVGSDLEDTMRTRTAADWEAWGEANDVPIAAVNG